MGVSAFALVKAISSNIDADGALPYWIYVATTGTMFASVAVQETAFVAQMAFFNRVSDPAIGGTYMTMLNTIANLGVAWPNTAALFLVDSLQWTRPCTCEPSQQLGMLNDWLPGKVARVLSQYASTEGADCACQPEVVVSGYTATCILSLAVGMAWLVVVRPRISKLQALRSQEWLARRIDDKSTV